MASRDISTFNDPSLSHTLVSLSNIHSLQTALMNNADSDKLSLTPIDFDPVLEHIAVSLCSRDLTKIKIDEFVKMLTILSKLTIGSLDESLCYHVIDQLALREDVHMFTEIEKEALRHAFEACSFHHLIPESLLDSDSDHEADHL